VGQKFWGVDISAVVAGAAKKTDLPNFTLTKKALSTPVTGALSGAGTPGTVTTYSVWGAITHYELGEYTKTESGFNRTSTWETDIQRGDKKIIIIAAPLIKVGAKPEPGDTITNGSEVYVIIHAIADAALAKWECQCRG